MSEGSQGGVPGAIVGLDGREAAALLARHGPNRVPERRHHPVLRFARRFWAPVPWMLEASLVLELVLARWTQATIVFVLLVLNATVAFVEERRARGALDLLRARLTVEARVLRDGTWRTLPAESLVPGDAIHVRMGDIVPADLEVLDGRIDVDQSSLTGESATVERRPGGKAYSASVVVHGEATGRVTATGATSYFGRTAELVRAARSTSHLEGVILRIVRSLVLIDVALVVTVLVDAFARHHAASDALPFALMLLVASVPVALPATFTLATAVGARELAQRGILVTRLSAVEEAASIDVLCSDKTGTLTENRLALATVLPLGSHTEGDVLRFAALASEAETRDPIDVAILDGCRARAVAMGEMERVEVLPFEPTTKRSEAFLRDGGRRLRVVKGAPHVVLGMVADAADAEARGAALGQRGERVLAVAAGPPDALALIGLLGFADPPRHDAKPTIAALADDGVRTRMVTGDGPATARAIATQVGLDGAVCDRRHLREAAPGEVLGATVFADMLPEDKFHLVETLQRAGHVVAMTGDGVNDAPALKQAEVGIALANATDVAKAAASIVLTRPGLADVLPAVHVGRQVYQRLLTYTLNKVIKTFHVTLFLAGAFLVLGRFVVTPRHIVLLLLANDFVTMALADDRVAPSRRPDRWNIRTLATSAFALAIGWIAFSFALFFVAGHALHVDEPQLQTLNFLGLAFSGQATVYVIRERQHLFRSRPSTWLLAASAVDIAVLVLLATGGVLVARVSLAQAIGVLGATFGFALALDVLKLAVFARTSRDA